MSIAIFCYKTFVVLSRIYGSNGNYENGAPECNFWKNSAPENDFANCIKVGGLKIIDEKNFFLLSNEKKKFVSIA